MSKEKMDKLQFENGEQVLCYHGQHLYEAKIVKGKTTKNGNQKFLVHYDGWSKNWDEWIDPEDKRIHKYNDEMSVIHNTKLKKNKVIKEVASSTKKSNRSKKGTKYDIRTNDVSKSSNALADITQKVEIKIEIPHSIKEWLVQDWTAINRANKLLKIPAIPTVKEIVEEYVAQRKSNDSGKDSVVSDVMYGLISYFNVMLGPQLLYKLERSQFALIKDKYPHVPMAEIYGSYHLLRLFVPLGQILSRTSLDEDDIKCFLHHIDDFFIFLIRNSFRFFYEQQFESVLS